MVDAIAGCVCRRRDRTGCERQDRGVSGGSLHARDAGRSAGGCAAGRAADHGRSQTRSGDFIGSTANELSDPWIYDGVPILMERGHGTFQIGQKASPLAIGIARSQHANTGTVPAEFPAGAGDQRSSSAGRRGRHPVPYRSRDRRAADRRAQGGSRCVGMADALLAEFAILSRQATSRCAGGASR